MLQRRRFLSLKEGMLFGIFLFVLVVTMLTRDTSVVFRLQPNDKIVAFGDSITFGYGVGASHSYPSILTSLCGHQIDNEGVSGETSAEGLERLAGVLEKSDAKLIILCMGGNDIIQGKSQKLLKDNLLTMVKMAKEKGLQVLLVGVPDITIIGLSTPSLYKEVAKEEKILLNDWVLEEVLSDPSLKNDPIHPNEAGYQMIADELCQMLRDQHIID